MAMRNTAGRRRHWRRSVGVAGLTLALAVVFGSGEVLRGAESVASNAVSSNAARASLEYQETPQSILTWSIGMAMQTAAFKKEPAAAGKSLRGILNFFGDASNAIPYLWQEDAGRLYLDLNRNQDLTDDPAGVFATPAVKQVSVQTFTNVHLAFNTAAGRSRLLADITLYDYNSTRICTLAMRSFWQGKLTLQGRDWQAGLVQNPVNIGPSSRATSFENSRLLLRAWEKRDQPFNANDGSLTTVPFSRKLFVDGHAYQVDWTIASQEGEAKPALQFTEQSVPLGELKITGQFIQRLVLPGGPYLVILDAPSGVVKIPTGNYGQPDIQLEEKGTVAFCDSRLATGSGRIAVDGKTTAVLKAGGPLTNSVTARRQGQNLILYYNLVGAGGETFKLAKQDTSKPPAFVIYKGDKKIASGNFEFG